MQQAILVADQQEERLSSLPVGVDTTRASRELRKSASAVAREPAVRQPQPAAVEEEEEEPAQIDLEPEDEADTLALEAAAAEAEAAVVARAQRADAVNVGVGRPLSSAPLSCRGGGTADGEPSAASGKENDDGMGPEANLRIQKAKLAVTLEELERLKQLLAKKSEQMAATEQAVRELQQKASLLSRSEKSLQNALEKERMASAEGTKKAEALERELGLLKKDSGESAKREKTQGAEQRSKDIRLNRALEELERTRSMLKRLKEEKDATGVSSRAETQKLAAENMRLRKRQSELILAFKKQAKLIDVLKRQKLHVEAATLLSFTEEEFSKTLELGEQLALA